MLLRWTACFYISRSKQKMMVVWWQSMHIASLVMRNGSLITESTTPSYLTKSLVSMINQSITVGRKLKAISASLISILKACFKDFSNSVFTSMQCLDPQFWNPSINYGIEEILSLCAHFKVPLEESGFDVSKVVKKWRQARKLISSHYLKPGDDFTAP